jgi:hypothetical protein
LEFLFSSLKMSLESNGNRSFATFCLKHSYFQKDTSLRLFSVNPKVYCTAL